MTLRSYTLLQEENEKLKAQAAEAAAPAGSARLAEAPAPAAPAPVVAGPTSAEVAALREQLRQLQVANVSLQADNVRLRASAVLAAAPRPATGLATPTRPGAAPVVATPAAPPPPPVRTHRIAAGDTLTRISSRYYGTPNRWQEIYDANRDKLRAPDALPVDVELKIP